ncbi:hypothetical protein SAMN04487843_105141 [Methylobacterium sp. ap11]|uniref:hypothetical protein n=1 Tax=Methylobacterium sp. ap11 TaxID=1761799 RepID=UPI0008C0B78A|nr:hypothetical protein [Methylobacterium sp. ap11]SEO94727.1 hypothetical protein SAMN04487843_105141 [Methylobacterium sp. ap11]
MGRPVRPRGSLDEVGTTACSEIDAACYVRPSVETVARLWDSHGWEACVERWAWLGRSAIERMAADGRRVLRARAGEAPTRNVRRKTTVEQEEAICAMAMAQGVHRASMAHGLRSTFVYRLLRERGVTEMPRLSTEERLRLNTASMAAARAARWANHFNSERTAA